MTNIGCTYNRWNEFQHGMKLYGELHDAVFTRHEIREAYHICFPDATDHKYKDKWPRGKWCETFTVAAQLQQGKEETKETETKKCWVGCGRDAAEGYESCCRTCSWYPHTRTSLK